MSAIGLHFAASKRNADSLFDYLRDTALRLLRPAKPGLHFALFPVLTKQGWVQGKLIYAEPATDGQMSYRLATPEEEADFVGNEAW